MKTNSSTQDTFNIPTLFPQPSSWNYRARQRPRQTIKPLELETNRPTLAERDALAHKQEVVCAVILATCLLFTLLQCMTQFGSL